MHIDLSKEFLEFIERNVKSGYYKNGAEVVREALRRMIRDEDIVINDYIREEVMKGYRQAEAGLSMPLDIKKIRKSALERIKRGDTKIKDSVKP